MKNEEILTKVAEEARKTLEGESSGHDWWHVYRVWKTAQHIGQEEGADMFVVELAALLHDIADYKLHNNDETIGPRRAREILEELDVEEGVVDHVVKIIKTSSFKGANVPAEMETLEGKIVQDADRLDAIGALGIGRTFAYGGNKGRLMWDPEKKPSMHNTKEEYINNNSPTINHFYEKLLLLRDLMNTDAARKLAEGRHKVMEEFLDQFFAEWEGKK